MVPHFHNFGSASVLGVLETICNSDLVIGKLFYPKPQRVHKNDNMNILLTFKDKQQELMLC